MKILSWASTHTPPTCPVVQLLGSGLGQEGSTSNLGALWPRDAAGASNAKASTQTAKITPEPPIRFSFWIISPPRGAKIARISPDTSPAACCDMNSCAAALWGKYSASAAGLTPAALTE